MTRSRLHSLFLLLAPLTAGLVLRLYELQWQIIGDDEFHALNTAMRHSYGHILTHLGVADHSIPLSLFYKVWLEAFSLTEMVMRAPMVVAGVATLLIFPRLVRPYLNQDAGSAYRWLLSISPLCIYFSRYARPYALTMFLAFAGLVAFYEWVRRGRRSMLVIYLVCGVVAPYLHLASAPILLAAPAYWIVRNATARGKQGGTHSYVRALLAVLAGQAILIGPALLLSRGLAVKLGRGVPDLETLEGTLELLSGVGSLWIALPLLALAFVETVRLYSLRPVWIQYFLFVVGVQVFAVLLSQPLWVHVPIVLTRYLLVILPVFLMLLASALGTAERGLASHIPKYPRGLATVAFSAFLLWSGPIRTTYYYPNNWTNHAVFQYSYDPSHPYAVNRLLEPGEIPEFYRTLGREKPASLTIVEAPWFYQWGINNQPFYQRVHRQHTVIGFITPSGRPVRQGELPQDRADLKFRHFLHLGDRGRLLATGVDFVILHKDLKKEVEQLPVQEVLEEIDVSAWMETYRNWFGDPTYEDHLIVVYRVGKQG